MCQSLHQSINQHPQFVFSRKERWREFVISFILGGDEIRECLKVCFYSWRQSCIVTSKGNVGYLIILCRWRISRNPLRCYLSLLNTEHRFGVHRGTFVVNILYYKRRWVKCINICGTALFESPKLWMMILSSLRYVYDRLFSGIFDADALSFDYPISLLFILQPIVHIILKMFTVFPHTVNTQWNSFWVNNGWHRCTRCQLCIKQWLQTSDIMQYYTSVKALEKLTVLKPFDTV